MYSTFTLVSNLFPESLRLLKEALKTVLKDPGFNVSASGREAQATASAMLEALGELHTDDLSVPHIVHDMVSHLQSCVFPRSKMWGKFLQMRTSAKFIAAWEKLMELTIQKQASPIFFQYISVFIFKELVKQRHPLLPDSKDSPQLLPQLNYEEENAVRYAAGYVVKHIRKKIERSTNKLKENLFVCLQDMCEISVLPRPFWRIRPTSLTCGRDICRYALRMYSASATRS